MSFNPGYGYFDHSWTKKELKAECRLRGITYCGLNKDSLVHELNASCQAAPPPPPPTYDYQNGTPTDQYGGGYSSETSSSDEGGGYAGYPNEAPPHSNERTGHPEEIEPCVDWSWTVKEMKYECWRRGLRNFARLNKGGLIRLLNGEPSPPSYNAYQGGAPASQSSGVVEATQASVYLDERAGYADTSNERTGHSEEKAGPPHESWPVGAPVDRSRDDDGRKGREKKIGSNTCIVCMDNDVNCTLVPCGHHCCCMNCAAEFEQCPVCRTNVQQKIKTFSA